MPFWWISIATTNVPWDWKMFLTNLVFSRARHNSSNWSFTCFVDNLGKPNWYGWLLVEVAHNCFCQWGFVQSKIEPFVVFSKANSSHLHCYLICSTKRKTRWPKVRFTNSKSIIILHVDRLTFIITIGGRTVAQWIVIWFRIWRYLV